MLNTGALPSRRLISTGRDRLLDHFVPKLETATHLNRQVVSFQTNKSAPIYRWFKYKEGFSVELVKYFLAEYGPKAGRLLDPFAGSGTSLFAGQDLGWKASGIELLPVGAFIMKARDAISKLNPKHLESKISEFRKAFSTHQFAKRRLEHISITKGAFPDETEEQLNRYLDYCATIKERDIEFAFRLAGFAILEDVSYTRKDGQYLRWDHRSSRDLSGKPFDKGRIVPFEEAVTFKLDQMVADLSYPDGMSLFESIPTTTQPAASLDIIQGSCLDKLPALPKDHFDFVITSPPYCNRYDYTRTYALELVYLGLDSSQVRELRQAMLSCTVENKEKLDLLRRRYDQLDNSRTVDKILEVYDRSDGMREVNSVLDRLRGEEKLNNNNIPRMVRNYFLELCFVIYELSRVLRSDGYCVMVNDNVRYGGEEVPVDLILSEFAENLGFYVEKILVLPRGKGNSSQQMGLYGRTEVRKCVYVWRKL